MAHLTYQFIIPKTILKREPRNTVKILLKESNVGKSCKKVYDNIAPAAATEASSMNLLHNEMQIL